jgi:hypothetical protein
MKTCAISASFATPFGQEIPAAATPVAVTAFPFSSTAYSLATAGVRPGGTVEELKKTCKTRGHGLSPEKNRITCDEDWTIRFVDSDGRASVLTFAYEKLLAAPQKDAQ